MSNPLSFGVEIVGDGIGEVTPKELAHTLDAAGVSYWVVGDGKLDASVVATFAARHSSHLGLVIAGAAHRDHPYNLARRLLSVDHAARGRVGWYALEADRRIALNAHRDAWTDHVLDATHTGDAITAVRALWRTWPLDSVIGDRSTGVFADISRIRRADVDNTYRISGPMNVPGSVQGDLPVWAGGDVAGADLVVIDEGEPLPDAATVVRVQDTAALERLDPRAVGVLARVTVDELPRVLSTAGRLGLLPAGTGGTLRQRLSLPVPNEPDLSTNPPAFSGPVNPGGRL